MESKTTTIAPPIILAPAGSRDSFLAALSAKADAVYCGLKTFSARMEANNFTIKELSPLSELAHKKKVKVYVAFNSLIKPDELETAGALIKELESYVKPDALIIQDLAVAELARQTGYRGELHLSTLGNLSFPEALKIVKKSFGISRVVIPRELGIDEIKSMADVCPDNVGLEMFVHGALCYGVSGRCYWSSFFGGKSGLRGQCVQPCRRRYKQKGEAKRFFSCQDLSLDILAKLLLNVPKVMTWKIEGRRKGPHYVFNTVTAYRIFRDHAKDPNMKKQAMGYLDQALGRKSTHYNFLSHRPQTPVKTEVQTGSGLLVGAVRGGYKNPCLVPRDELLAGDLLRVGYEDEPGHTIFRVPKYIPKKGRLYLKPFKIAGKAQKAPVFLLDRREEELKEMLSKMDEELNKISCPEVVPAIFNVRPAKRPRKRMIPFEMNVQRKPGRNQKQGITGVWLPLEDFGAIPKKGVTSRCWWWLPPVVWPGQESRLKDFIEAVLKKGARNFVLNSPWQISFFRSLKGLDIWAGPFCNQANQLSISVLESIGFSGVIVSPELGREDIFKLCRSSPLPMGIVISGNWPLCISRTISQEFKTQELFVSPMGEYAWVARHGDDFWVYPNWELDLTAKRDELIKAGCKLFVHMEETLPGKVSMKKRPGLWNWKLKLL